MNWLKRFIRYPKPIVWLSMTVLMLVLGLVLISVKG